MKAVTKAWIFLIIVSLTLVVLGHHWAGREGLLTALIFSLSINSFVYFFEDQRVLSLLGGKELEGQDSHGLRDTVRRLSIKARVPAPRIIIIPHSAPQAAVVGRGITHGTIILTEGCLTKFSGLDLEAILAYQLACIQSLNTLAFAVGSFLTSVGLIAAGTLDSGLRFLIVEKKNQKIIVSQLFTRLVSPVLGFILRLSIRPSYYSSADTLAAQILDDPKRFAKALWMLDSYSRTLPYAAPLSTAHMFIVSPLTTLRWTKSYVAQPKTSDRIRNLIGYYPI